jgi:hypothetical protein
MDLYNYLKDFYDFFTVPAYELPKGPWPYGEATSVYLPFPMPRQYTKEMYEAEAPEKITGFKYWLMNLGKESPTEATPIGRK